MLITLLQKQALMMCTMWTLDANEMTANEQKVRRSGRNETTTAVVVKETRSEAVIRRRRGGVVDEERRRRGRQRPWTREETERAFRATTLFWSKPRHTSWHSSGLPAARIHPTVCVATRGVVLAVANIPQKCRFFLSKISKTNFSDGNKGSCCSTCREAPTQYPWASSWSSALIARSSRATG